MSKNKINGSTTSSKKVPSGFLAHMAKIAANKAIKIKEKEGVVPLIVVLVLSACCFFLESTHLVGYAMLYIMADNGRKSGRADGNVYMINNRVRRWVNPALVQNAKTTAARALLSQYSSGWETLTDSERASWLNMSWLFRTNRIGLPVMIKGKAAFITLNINLTLIGQGAIATAPADSGGVLQITDFLGTVADQSLATFSLGFNPTPTDANVDHLISCTRVLPSGVSRPRRSDFKVVAVVPNSTGSPFGLGSFYTAVFGDSWNTDASNVGKKIFIKATPINNTTGATGADLVGFTEIQA